MYDYENNRPSDVRGFFHKKILGFVGGLGIPVVSQVAKTVRAILPGNGGARAAVERFPGERNIAAAAPCPSGFRMVRGQCVPIEGRGRDRPGIAPAVQRFLPGGRTGEFEFGEAVMGQYGAGLEPGVRETDTLICPRGTVLGTDDICYNRRDIRNDERKWPRGRRPLLTGGEMGCISTASAAAKKLQRKTKQLQGMGMLPKPSRRRAAPRQLKPGTPTVYQVQQE